MSVRPIRTDADYRYGLARVAVLIGAAPGTPEADELEVLSALIERYERRVEAVEAPTALDAIRFRMDQLGLSSRDLEPFIGSRARVSEVLGGVRPLSIDMIRALNRHLGIPAEVLIQPAAPPRIEIGMELSKPATRQLVASGLLGAGESVQEFFTRAFGRVPAQALWRKTRTARTNAKTDPVALRAWCAGVALRAAEVDVRASFETERIDLGVVRSLAKLSAQEDGPQRAMAALLAYGIVPVVLAHLPGTHLDGAALRRSDGVPVIALTLRRDRIDNFWFTLLHELAHVARHLSADDPAILDDLEVGSEETIEGEADRMAELALIPQDNWSGPRTGPYASMADILGLAAEAEVHPAIVAGRWQRENRDFRKFSRLLGHGAVRPQFPGFHSAP